MTDDVTRGEEHTDRGRARLLALVLLALFGFVLLNTAWLSDDAFITFRVADNWIHGDGLRWNVADRVQTYTNPLWLLLVAPCYAVTREMFFTPLLLSVALSLAVAALLLRSQRDHPWRWAPTLGLLLCSRAFIDYSSSGLENPLTHLLLAAFLVALFHGDRRPRSIFCLSLLAHGCILNRMDTALLVWPALAWAVWAARGRRTLLAALAGTAPFVLWELFSVAYYGFPFPNTAYAKLGGGLSRAEYVAQGLFYFLDSLGRDHLTLPAILFGLIVTAFRRDARRLSVALGILLYLLYIAWAGGDFMSGRFFAAPCLCAAVLLAQTPFRFTRFRYAAALMLMALLSPYVPYPMDYLGDQKDKFVSFAKTTNLFGVTDERAFYFYDMALKQALRGRPVLRQTNCAQIGRELRGAGPAVRPFHAVGVFGFLGGRDLHVIDLNALGDPLLARLPAQYIPVPRPGHYARALPPGYDHAVTGDSGALEDPGLRAYFEQLLLITRGPLWSRARWRAILEMNLGRCEHLINRDACRFPGLTRLPLDHFNVAGEPTAVPKTGLEIALGSEPLGNALELSFDADDRYDVLFMRGTDILWRATLGPDLNGKSGLVPYRLALPQLLRQRGCTAIRLMPWLWGDMQWLTPPRAPENELFSVGHVAFAP